MGALKKIARELVGLFVDDGSLAAVVLVWIAVCGLVLPSGPWHGLILFLGLALILVENVLRGARKGHG
jgi:hypothetical protein